MRKRTRTIFRLSVTSLAIAAAVAVGSHIVASVGAPSQSAKAEGSDVSGSPLPLDLDSALAQAIEVMAKDAPASQRDALLDGLVTFDEYTSAARRTLECIRERVRIDGYQIAVSEPVLSQDGHFWSWNYRTQVAATERDLAASTELLLLGSERWCYDEFFEQVNESYRLGLMPTDDERGELAISYTSCIDAATRSGIAPGDLRAAFAAEVNGGGDPGQISRCRGEHSRLFMAPRVAED